jgi:hypothetical protein
MNLFGWSARTGGTEDAMSEDIHHVHIPDDLSSLTVPATEPARWRAGSAVRRDWPDGTHELVGFSVDEDGASRFLARDRRYWQRGPLRPTAWRVVVVSRRDFDLHGHRRDCRAPDCPS